MALQAIRGYLDKIPVFLTLREWDQPGDYPALMALMVKQFRRCNVYDSAHVVEYLLNNTNLALVLFDGLDEIPNASQLRDQTIAAICSFSREYPRAQILVTSRISATEYTFEGFKYLEIADFNDEQMQAFVGKWFNYDAITAQQFWDEINQPENQGLRELGRSPLLLTMLCLAYSENMSFPHRRADLYTEALDALIKKWDSSRRIRRDSIYKQLSPLRKQQLFAWLAALSFEAEKYIFTQEALTSRMTTYLRNLPQTSETDAPDGEFVLRAIEAQHGIFVECAHRLHAFAHLTFQEYYTARYIVDNARHGTFRTLFQHVADIRWREVVLLTASLLDSANDFFVYFLKILNNLVERDAFIIKSLTWIAHKTIAVNLPYKSVAIRAYYMWIDLDNVNAPSSTSILRLARQFDSALDVALDDDLALDRSLIIDCVRSFELANRRPLEFEQGLARAVGSTYRQKIVLSLERSRAVNLAYSRNLGLDDLSTGLSELEIPSYQDSEEVWRIFANQLQEIAIHYRDIGYDWSFSEEQFQIYERYLYAVDLFVESLGLAYVTNREAILDHLRNAGDLRGHYRDLHSHRL